MFFSSLLQRKILWLLNGCAIRTNKHTHNKMMLMCVFEKVRTNFTQTLDSKIDSSFVLTCDEILLKININS